MIPKNFSASGIHIHENPIPDQWVPQANFSPNNYKYLLYSGFLWPNLIKCTIKNSDCRRHWGPGSLHFYYKGSRAPTASRFQRLYIPGSYDNSIDGKMKYNPTFDEKKSEKSQKLVISVWQQNSLLNFFILSALLVCPLFTGLDFLCTQTKWQSRRTIHVG